MAATQKAASKTAASKPASSTTETPETSAESRDADSGRSGRDSAGPGTGNAAAPENSSRPPATIVNTDPSAAPLAPPADAATQREPALGHPESTTDQPFAETGGRTIAGESHGRIVDENGKKLSADDLFDDSDPNKTFVTTKVRVFEEFTYPNTSRVSTRLMWVPGARVPRFQAERIKAALAATRE